ncbi:protein PXR1-like [Nicotiana sylvestris]|uniref:protein PXR1-like n=1 Tax=Nicotiana sylvestris TaxID=4096 RepID=UPI00388C8D5F
MYKLDKALYGLKQAPRAWYESSSKYLLEHGYKRDLHKRFLSEDPGSSRLHVAEGEQIKKINKQLKANQADEAQKFEDYFKFANEREEIVSSETEQVISGPNITSETISEVAENIENSYNPKRKKSLGVKIPGTAWENKKRRLNLLSLKRLLPQDEELKGFRRSRVRLKLKALKESKRKVIAKGKKKVVEPVEAVEIEEMDLVLHDEEVEVVTPKAKKIKNSKNKSPSKTKSAEPSTLARRTKSTIKSRKVKLEEEEDSEEKEEPNAEKDKIVKFGKRTILKGRLLRELEEEGMMMLLEKL